MHARHHQRARLVLGRVIHQHFALDDEGRQHPCVVLGEALDAGVKQLDAALLWGRGLRISIHMVDDALMIQRSREGRLNSDSMCVMSVHAVRSSLAFDCRAEWLALLPTALGGCQPAS